ncbi:MAG: DUF4249 family protein [Bacteroidales bacterium]|nr:DUF4249 family protein [Bacteroidales bacterium]
MKKYTAIAILLATLGLCSCEERFELEGVNGEPRMFVECYAGLTDTTYVRLYKAMPVNAKASDGDDFTLKRMEFKVNGAPLTLHRDEISLFWTPDPIPGGSEISITVETKEAPKVIASSTVPAKTAFSVDASVMVLPPILDEDMLSYICFKLKFPGGVAPTDHFGVSILEYDQIHRDDGSEDTDYTFSQAPTSVTVGEINLGDMATEDFIESRRLSVLGYNGAINYAACSGEEFPDGEVNAYMMYSGYEPTWKEYKWDDEGEEIIDSVTVTRTTRFQVQVLKFADESFGYLNSVYNRQTNYFSMLGFSPPTIAYTNVSGGYGVLGGISLSESDIIDAADLL